MLLDTCLKYLRHSPNTSRQGAKGAEAEQKEPSPDSSNKRLSQSMKRVRNVE